MGNMRKKIALLMLFVFFMHDLFSQCAMCKAIAEEQAEEDGSTVNSGILYIMVIPYIILFIVFRKKIFSFFKDLKKAGVSQSKD
jgi:Na+/H+ antiporter NhaC